jgi:DNA-binding response OmpR family regulator
MVVLQKNSSLRVLIIEDNYDMVQNIAEHLENCGHTLDFAYDGIGGLHLALTNDYDVIILDVMLPGMDGLTVCSELRKKGEKSTPVLMLTARDTIPDKLSGFDVGADDYLIKPFSLRELEARLRALTRRKKADYATKLRVADLEIDTSTRTVRRAGQVIELNRKCLEILEILMRAYPELVLRKDLEYALWGDTPPTSDALRSHIYLLRRAIDKPFNRPLLKTFHGFGYQLSEHDD